MLFAVNRVLVGRKAAGTHLIAPGSTVTSATEMPVAIVNTLESAILTDPPARGVALTWESAYVYGLGTWPCGF